MTILFLYIVTDMTATLSGLCLRPTLLLRFHTCLFLTPHDKVKSFCYYFAELLLAAFSHAERLIYFSSLADDYFANYYDDCFAAIISFPP